MHDIKSLLTDPDKDAQSDSDLDADVVMLWDGNGRAVASGTSYEAGAYLDPTDDFLSFEDDR